ncbi:hypothetical protein H0E87_003409 [Populus deltoides]|uniref:K Homology domain-containing protein n=1 Tax=Populus deltoides TaxID=3696 RepID=A0A8T2ZYX9_POPDE|nr:hypothetical protein H0E87_003409 [Populus deltoides]
MLLQMLVIRSPDPALLQYPRLLSLILENGQLLTIPPYLVKIQRHHLHHLEQYGADLILGCKGFVWVGEHVKAMDSTTIEDQLNNSEQQLIKYKTTSKDMLQESRQSLCRIANAIHVLSSLGFTLTLEREKLNGAIR